MIHKLVNADTKAILTVVNDAAFAYKGKIPNDRWKEPYMSKQELKKEIRDGVIFYGCSENNELIAVMGVQPVNDVTLIRHAYTLTCHQRRGVGEQLLKHLLSLAKTTRIYVGTWEEATWAIKFYQKSGFKMVSAKEKNILLKKYWRIPERQIETSVVLELKRQMQ